MYIYIYIVCGSCENKYLICVHKMLLYNICIALIKFYLYMLYILLFICFLYVFTFICNYFLYVYIILYFRWIAYKGKRELEI